MRHPVWPAESTESSFASVRYGLPSVPFPESDPDGEATRLHEPIEAVEAETAGEDGPAALDAVTWTFKVEPKSAL
jgi:hypothetical protein